MHVKGGKLRIKVSHLRKFPNIEGMYTRKDMLAHKPDPKGGMTKAYVRLNSGEIVTGYARCSDLDNFSRKIGRNIAVGRAMKEANMLLDEPESNSPGFIGSGNSNSSPDSEIASQSDEAIQNEVEDWPVDCFDMFSGEELISLRNGIENAIESRKQAASPS